MIESVNTTAKLNSTTDFSSVLTSEEQQKVNEIKAHLGPSVLAKNPLFNDDLSLLRWGLALDFKLGKF